MFTQRNGLRIDHMEHKNETREHEWSRDCWCNPTVERFNKKTGEWEEVK